MGTSFADIMFSLVILACEDWFFYCDCLSLALLQECISFLVNRLAYHELASRNR